MDTRLIELLVCPVCKGPLQRGDEGKALVCPADRLAFPIRDGIPVMLENEAVSLDAADATPATLPPAPTGQPG
ncbi:MAG TPA: Trm112 family protein [Candidatus Aquabacterium excrementipullorum]|nr:Trm112 family protein [Candidatus Aquabacterium excrementipullorum]